MRKPLTLNFKKVNCKIQISFDYLLYCFMEYIRS